MKALVGCKINYTKLRRFLYVTIYIDLKMQFDKVNIDMIDLASTF